MSILGAEVGWDVSYEDVGGEEKEEQQAEALQGLSRRDPRASLGSPPVLRPAATRLAMEVIVFLSRRNDAELWVVPGPHRACALCGTWMCRALPCVPCAVPVARETSLRGRAQPSAAGSMSVAATADAAFRGFVTAWTRILLKSCRKESAVQGLASGFVGSGLAGIRSGHL